MCWKTALWPHLERAWKGWNPFEIRLLFGPLLVSLCFWMVCVAVKRFQDSPVGHVPRRASVECASIATVWINIHTRRRMWERTTELFKLTHWHRNNLPSIFSCYLPSHIHPPTILLCKIQHLMSICHPASDRHISAGALSLSIPHTSCRCYYRAAFYSGIPSSPTTSSCCYRRIVVVVALARWTPWAKLHLHHHARWLQSRWSFHIYVAPHSLHAGDTMGEPTEKKKIMKTLVEPSPHSPA